MAHKSTQLRETLSSISFDMRLFGLCMYVAWIEVIFSGDAFVPAPWMNSDAATAIFPVATLGLAIGLLIMALKPIVAGNFLTNRFFLPVTALIGAACTLIVCVPGQLPAFCFYGAAFCAGACSSVIAMFAGVAIAELDSRTVAIVLALAQVMSVCVFSFEVLMSRYAGGFGAAVVLCLFLPCAALFLSFHKSEAPLLYDEISLKMPKGFWRLAIALALIEFACASVRGFLPTLLGDFEFEAARWITSAFAVFAMIAIIAYVGSMPLDAPFGAIFYYVLLAVSLLLPFVVLLGYGSVYSGVLATVLFMVSLLVCWAILLRVTYKTGASVVTVFGVGFAVAAFGSDFGLVFGSSVMSVFPQENMVGLSMVIVLFCVAGAFILLKKSDLQAMMQPGALAAEDAYESQAAGAAANTTDLLGKEKNLSRDNLQAITSDNPDSQVQNKAFFKARCDFIAEHYMLSGRETEVFHLMARGNDAQAIADSLVVSYNTARTHIRNIYNKMGVHSRHDFFEILNDPENRI